MNPTQPLSPAQAKLIRLHLALIPVYGWLLLVWTTYAVDLGVPGHLDRSGHIKGHDFAHFYVLGSIANDHAAADLYNFSAQADRMDALVPSYPNRFAPIHGPQMSLLFAPLARLPYGPAVTVWLLLSAAGYAVCCFLLWSTAPALKPYGWVAMVLAAGYPAFYLLIAFGQNTVFALVCVTTAYLALRAQRPWLAGLALGSLVYKPGFGMALPFVLLYGREWRMIAGATIAVLVQLGAGAAYFGIGSLRQYFEAVTHVGEIAEVLEPIPDQMQSLRSFFSVLLPWPDAAFIAYLVTAAGIVWVAARCWRSGAALELRFSVLLLATILANPHVNPYDLVALTPVFFLIPQWALSRNRTSIWLWTLLYLCYYLPGLSFVPTLTRVQFSVIAMVALTLVLSGFARLTRGQSSRITA
jgi:alpha-1,2-mannosyltransferase